MEPITDTELQAMLDFIPDHRDDLRRDIERTRTMIARFDWQPPKATVERLRSTVALYRAEAESNELMR